MLWKWGYSSANRAQIFKARHRTDRHCHCDSLNLPSKSVSERKARTKRRVTKSIRGQSYNYFKIQCLALKPPKTELLNRHFLQFRNRKWGSARVRSHDNANHLPLLLSSWPLLIYIWSVAAGEQSSSKWLWLELTSVSGWSKQPWSASIQLSFRLGHL